MMPMPAVLLAMLAMLAGVTEPNPKFARTWHELVGVLQYLEVDYPKAVALHDPEELAEQKLYAAKARNLLNSTGNSGADDRQAMELIEAQIGTEQSPDEVARACVQLAQRVLRERLGDPSPARPPDLRRGEALWREQCASCHGADGAAQTPAALAMTPPAANLLSVERGTSLTPYRVFNATSFGIEGTAMPAFSLAEADRWAVAFYALGLRARPCDHPPSVAVSVQMLAHASDAALAAIVGSEEVGCARTHLPTSDSATPAEGLRHAQRLYAMGRRDAARSALVNTWSQLEPTLDYTDAATRARLEEAYRHARRGEHFEAAIHELLNQLEARPPRWWRWLALAGALIAVLGVRRRWVR